MRYNRTNFYDTVIVNNKSEYDLIMNKFDKFTIARPTRFYTVIESDLKRPDVISLKCYSNVDYFWIIGKVNCIDDFWNDLSVGDVLIIPDQLDIEDFLLNARISN
jgi:hypothetical protein